MQKVRKPIFEKIIINQWEEGALFEKGKFVKMLGSGKYRINNLKNQVIYTYDTRVRKANLIYAAEFDTSDGISIKLSIGAFYKIVDVGILATGSNDYWEIIAEQAKTSIHQFVSSQEADQITLKLKDIQDLTKEAIEDTALKLGIKIESVTLPVITLSKKLKQAMEAELVAKKRSKADLEDARGRTAVMRHLMNTSEMVEKHPMLIKLLLGQKAKNVQLKFSDKDDRE